MSYIFIFEYKYEFTLSSLFLLYWVFIGIIYIDSCLFIFEYKYELTLSSLFIFFGLLLLLFILTLVLCVTLTNLVQKLKIF